MRADPQAPAKLCAAFENMLGCRVFALNSARAGLTIALQAMARTRPGRLRVVLPAYICPAVSEAVRAAGLLPVFAAVGPDLNLEVEAAREALAREPPLAVVAAHMYACPARINELAALCELKGVFLIDDAAHFHRLLGGRGAVGLVSFAQSKTITTGVRGSGGLLVVNDEALLPAVSQAVAQLPVAAHRGEALMHFASDYLAPRWAAKLMHWGQRLVKPTPRHWYQPARISAMEAGIALAQFERLDDIIGERLRVIDLYANGLQRVPRVSFMQYAPNRYLSRVVVRVPAANIGARLARRGIFSRAGYSTVAGHLVELPLDVTMCAGDVERVCESLHMLVH